MARPKRDEAREDRISMEIVVDAYDAFERWPTGPHTFPRGGRRGHMGLD